MMTFCHGIENYPMFPSAGLEIILNRTNFMYVRQMASKVTYLLFVSVFLILTSCATGVDPIQTGEGETSVPINSAPAPTRTSKATRMPEAISTPTPTLPDRTVRANAPKASPTSLPTPTLTETEQAENLAKLMKTNGGCELPCWWGIVPAETRVESVKEQLVEIGASWLGDSYATIGVNWGLSLEFETHDGIVHSTDIGSSYVPGVIDRDSYTEGWQRYSLARILNRHGVPTRVLVYSPFRADPGGGPGYHLLVFYEDLGIEIEYRGSAQQLNGRHYRACPDLEDIWDIGLFLYQPEQVENVVERVLPAESVSYIAGPDTVFERISWEQATGTSLQFFYDTFSKPDNETCFEFSTG